MEARIDDLVDYVKGLDLKDALLIGHSFGGVYVSQAAESERISTCHACTYGLPVESMPPEDPDACRAAEPHQRRRLPSGCCF